MKKCSIISLFLALILCVPISAGAHAGDTDASGGHYDHSTGEYHYHHGYPAHQHYDMDGDGFRDCPYDFDDQTGANSGSSSSSGGSTDFTPLTYRDGFSDGYDYGYGDGQEEGYDAGYKDGQENGHSEGYSKGAESLYGLIGFLVLCLIALCIAFCIVIKRKNDIERNYSIAASQYEKKLKSFSDAKDNLKAIQSATTELQQKHDQVAAKLTLEQNTLLELRKETVREQLVLESTRKCRQRIKEAPPDITFAEDGEPVYWKPDVNKPYGDYTVYLNKTGTIYHTDRFCASYSSSVRHIFTVISTSRPCEKCAKHAFDFTSVPDWYSHSPASNSHRPVYSVAQVEEKALQMGVSVENAKQIINMERISKGLSLVVFEE